MFCGSEMGAQMRVFGNGRFLSGRGLDNDPPSRALVLGRISGLGTMACKNDAGMKLGQQAGRCGRASSVVSCIFSEGCHHGPPIFELPSAGSVHSSEGQSDEMSISFSQPFVLHCKIKPMNSRSDVQETGASRSQIAVKME
jgi:hypothetical protein